MDTTQRDLREIDQRIAALNISITEQLAALNLSLNGRLTEIQSDLDHHRWQTHYYHKNTLSRLAKLESGGKDDRFLLLKIVDPEIILKAIVLVGMGATGIITWAELGKLAIN